MKRMTVIIIALLASISMFAQLRFSAEGGYQLTNQTLYIKGSSMEQNLGWSHGFYAGGMARFSLGSNFSVGAGLRLSKFGSKFHANGNEFVSGLNESSRSIAYLYSDEYLSGYSESDKADIRKQGILEFKYGKTAIDTENLKPEMLYPILKNSKIQGELTIWNISIPLSVSYGMGPLAITAGVDIGVNFAEILECKTSVQASGFSADIFDVESESTQKALYRADYYIHHTDKGDYDENGKMDINDFLRKDVFNLISFGAHAGAEITPIDHITVKIIYYHDILSNIRADWSKSVTGASSAVQIGLEYSF